MTRDELEGAKTRRYFTGSSGMKETMLFNYRHPFGLYFKYRHQLDGHDNQRHVPIYLESTRETKFWSDCKFAWYLYVSEFNTDLASGHFKNYWVVQPSLDFGR